MLPSPDREAIVAIATPPGDGSRAMIRVSGTGVLAAMASMVDGPAHESLRDHARGIAPGRLRMNGFRGAMEIPVLVATAAGPRSFTGEDVVELQVPGRGAVATRVRDACMRGLEAAGVPARAAGPGEFSARAYLAGRLSAMEAVAIALSIDASTDADLQAVSLMRELDGRRLIEVRGRLISILARIEAGIDFTDEEDVVACTAGEAAAACEEAVATLATFRRTLAAARAGGDDLPRFVFEGPPNAGKSTLVNALAGSHRMVVAPVEGTTRDAVEILVRWPDPSGVAPDTCVMLVDTAGIGTTNDPMADEAAAMGRLATSRATVVVRCHPVATESDPALDAREDEPARPGGPGLVSVRTKADLRTTEVPSLDDTANDPIEVSALSGAGLTRLRTRLQTALEGVRAGSGSANIQDLVYRLVLGTDEAVSQLTGVLASVRDLDAATAVPMPEVVAATLRLAIESLGTLDGAVDPELVLDEVFGRFCVGK